MRIFRFQPVTGEAILSGAYIKTGDAAGLAKSCELIRMGEFMIESVLT